MKNLFKCFSISKFITLAGVIVYTCINSLLLGQNIPYTNSQVGVDTTCAWNPDVNFFTTIGWTLYQTTNDKYNGPIDSSVCASLKVDQIYPFSSYAPDDFNLSKPIFIKADLDSSNKIPLQPNEAYRFDMYQIYNPYGAVFGGECEDNVCSGVFLAIQSVYNDSITLNKRWYKTEGYHGEYSGYGFCFASEKFDEQYLTDFIYKITFENIPTDTIKEGYQSYFDEVSDVELVSDLIIDPYEVGIDSFLYIWYPDVYSGTAIIIHDKDGIPGAGNIDTAIVQLVENTEMPAAITIKLAEQSTLLFQPATTLMGGYPLTGDERHRIHIINEGGNLCLVVVELIFENGSSYRHVGGTIDLSSPIACMSFRKGGKLIINKDSELSFGIHQQGILALGTGAEIRLEENSSLRIGSDIMLYTVDNQAQPIYIHLPKGTSVTFEEGCKIYPAFPNAEEMQLCFIMEGGFLNEGNLSEESKKYVHRIYPEDIEEQNHYIQIYPNPIEQDLLFDVYALDSGPLRIQIFSASGETIFRTQTEVVEGNNKIQISLPSVPGGTYQIKTQLKNGITTTPFVCF